MAGQSKSDDPNIVKKSLFPILLHVIIFKLLYSTKFNEIMIGGQNHFWDILVHFLYISLFPDLLFLKYIIYKINFKLLNAPKSIKNLCVPLFRIINKLTKNSKNIYTRKVYFIKAPSTICNF